MNVNKKILVIPLLGFLFALGLHLWHLGQPSGLVSDEFYFVQDAQSYTTHTAYLDAHPPLGKLQMAVSIALFGDRPFAWRIVNAVEGALMLPLLFWLGWLLTKDRRVAVLAMMLGGLDGFLLVDSRLGLINIPYVLYSFIVLACILQALQSKHAWRWVLAAGIFAGAAISVKWLAALVVLPAMFIWFFPHIFGYSRPKTLSGWLPASLGLLVVIPMCIYVGVWRVHDALLGIHEPLFSTNIYLLKYHLSGGEVGHLYREVWWRWLFLWRPFLYWNVTTATTQSSIWSMGNPWVWWTGIPVVLFSLIRGWRLPTVRLLNVFLLASWLPFIAIRRDMFLYHAIPFGSLLFLLIAVQAGVLWQRKKKLVIGYIVITALVWLWFLPWYMNLPLSLSQYHLRQWLPTWYVR